MRFTATICGVLVGLLVSLPVAWGDVATETGDAEARIAWIQKALDEDSGASKLWQVGWTGAYGTLALFEGANAVAKDGADEKDERFDSTVNAITSLLGVGGLLLDPLTLHGDAARLALMPQGSPAEIALKQSTAELYLRRSAEREERGRSLQTHLINGAVNLAAGLAVSFDGGRTEDGLAIFGVGMLLSEAQILTTPRLAIANWAAYQNGASNHVIRGRLSIRDAVFVCVAPGYVQLSLLF